MRSLAVLIVAVTSVLVFQGCGSDSPSGAKKSQTSAMCTQATYCPMVMNLPGCCVPNVNVCGVNMNGGCVPIGTKPDAGAH
jgi:hypothetical protein